MPNKTYTDKIRERFLNKKRQASLSKSPSHADLPEVTQRISKSYLQEESEVQEILQGRIIAAPQDNGRKEQLDRENDFFSKSVFEPEFEDAQNGDDNVSIKTEDEVHASPTHNASSYLQIEELDCVEPWIPQTMLFDDEELFWDAETDPVPVSLDILSRETRDEGLFVPEAPKVSQKRLDFFTKRTDKDGVVAPLQNYSGPKIDAERVLNRIVPTFIPPSKLSQYTPTYLLEDKIIRIQVQEIAFHNHPLFSEEERVAKTTELLFADYTQRTQNREIEKLESQLENLRKIVASDDGDDKMLQRKYKSEIKTARTSLYREERHQKKLIRNILENWKELKTIRERQNFNSTSLKLNIRLDEVDPDDDQKIWDERFEAEFNEIMAERYESYYDDKRKLKAQIKDDESIELGARTKKPNADEVRDEVLEMYMNSFRQPGDPKVIIEMLKIPFSSISHNAKEIKRRAMIASRKYFIKLLFDDTVVTSPKEVVMNANFVIDLNAAFTIKLTTTVPEKITFDIYESSVLGVSSKISSLYLPVPDQSDLFNDVEYHCFDFTANNFKYSNSTLSSVIVSGVVKVKIGWTRSDPSAAPKADAPIKQKEDIQKNLKTWYDNQVIDPLDPDNTALIKVIASTSSSAADQANGGDKNEYFRFNEDLTAFCTEEEFNQNIRFNVLRARHENNIKYTNMKLIPQLDREMAIPEERKIIEETLGMDPIDLQRHRGKKYLKKVYETISHHIKLLQKDNEDCNILIGDEVPTFGSVSLALFEMFGPKRPLKPTRRAQSNRASCRVQDIPSFNVIVNVERVFGIPVRSDEQNGPFRKNSNLSSTAQSFKTVNVRPYISVMYKDKIIRTSTAEGSNPTWNEQLVLNINNKLTQMKGSLSIQLFDEYIEDLLEDDRSRTTDIYQRISSKWIGELRIPIGTIYTNQRIEGIFEINTPSILLGYSKSSFGVTEQPSNVFGSLPDTRNATHISLFISVDPLIEIDVLNMSCLESIELEQMRAFIGLWHFEMKNEFPWRPQYSVITLLNGKRACITRLIGEIPIPFEKNEDAEFLIRRYVSLIPVTQSLDTCVELDGVWLINSQIINLTCASPKDLGILLTCFYTELGIKAWAILGYGLPSGNSCYVLIRESNEFFIIDPLTGKKYNSRDTYCPLVKVYSLVNETNVWANIQKEKRVYMTQFDVNRWREWRPLFNKSTEAPSGLVHDENFEYTLSLDVADLQRIVEMKLVKKISVWRTHRKTIWNRYMNENLQNVLMDLEQSACFEYNSEPFTDKLSILFSAYKVNGFPINMPYSNLSSIVERVKATGIHSISDENVEFSLAVRIFDYPRNIFSVWIFLVSLVPKT